MSINTKNYQLLGCCALHIASKHEDEFSISVSEWVYLSDKAFNEEDFVYFQKDVLEKLEWKLMVPTLCTRMGEYTKTEELVNKSICMAMLNIVAPHMQRWDNSIIATIYSMVVQDQINTNIFSIIENERTKNSFMWSDNEPIIGKWLWQKLNSSQVVDQLI